MLQIDPGISPVTTHHFSIDDFDEVFDIMRSAHSRKVKLSWAG